MIRSIVFIVLLFASTFIYSQNNPKIERVRMYLEPNLGANRPTSMRFLYSYEDLDSLNLFTTITENDLLVLAEDINFDNKISNVTDRFKDEHNWIYLLSI